MAKQSTNAEPLAALPEVFACQPELLLLFDELVSVIFCMKSVDGRYVAVNQAFVRRTGRRSRREVLNQRASDLFAEPLAQVYEAQDDEILATRRPIRDELEVIDREDGTLGWYLTTKFPVFDDDTDEALGVVTISRDLATPSQERVVIESLQGVVRFVQDNLPQQLRVADLAAVADCSKASLERRMKRVFGVTPTQYVLQTRVDRAAELLTTTDLPLSQVGAEVGFYDQADFTRRFARLTGDTPAQFRKKNVKAAS
jgi:PAS domain S-box-containing protein